MLFALCAGAAALAVITLGGVVYEVIHGASPSISHFGFGFVFHNRWNPTRAPAGISAAASHGFEQFGAGAMIYGTVVSSLIAIVLAAPLGIAIAVYLSMIAPPRVRAVVGPLVEMLAAVPSIIMGFWGLVVLAPFVQSIEPGLHSALGFIPIFGAPQTTGLSLFTAGLVLTLMILPIVAALSKDLFLTVPRELKDGAAALGATRWEVIRGIVLPSTASGVAAATILALGRALGEAIAVSLVIGNLTQIHLNSFQGASTIGALIANQFPSGGSSALHIPSMYYLALVLLAIGLLSSLAARAIGRRFDVHAQLVAT
jgi:phosphate transport system permease protein